MELKRELGLLSAVVIVVASMFGTGIFVTTGIVLGMTNNSLLILILWVIGGLVALTGALCYAELASIFPHAGGEYIYLKKIFGFLPAFLTGWISLVVGFSASIAISALTMVKYLSQFLQSVSSTGAMDSAPGIWSQKMLAAGIILLLGIIHIHGIKQGSWFQNFLTTIKLIIILCLIGFGIYFADWNQAERLIADYSPNNTIAGIPTIGLSLLIIMFSYSGWNGASYIAGEIKNPERNLPLSLFFGTLFTMILYITLNVIFLISTPGQELMGKEAVGAIATQNLFGNKISTFFTLGIVLILLSYISVQMMIGPRVYYAMSKDKMIFNALGKISPKFESPGMAIAIQIIISIVYVLIGNAEFLMAYMGFALGIFPLLAVIGLVYLRIKYPDLPRPYKVPLYPYVPIIFITLSVFMMIAGLLAWTSTSIIAIVVVMLGVPIFYLWRIYQLLLVLYDKIIIVRIIKKMNTDLQHYYDQ